LQRTACLFDDMKPRHRAVLTARTLVARLPPKRLEGNIVTDSRAHLVSVVNYADNVQDYDGAALAPASVRKA
jgi:hypothetical protein